MARNRKTTKLRSRKLLEKVLQPHTDLAMALLRQVRSANTGDPTHRFQIARLIVFLAGVDKTLSLSLELLYLAGAVNWKWLIRGGPIPEPGVITCNPGLTAKLNKLRELGLDLTELQWMVDLRNLYIHQCSISAGYRVKTGRGRLISGGHGPEISHSGEPLTGWDANSVGTYTQDLAKRLGEFVDGKRWQRVWTAVAKQIQRLPINPEPAYSMVISDTPIEDLFDAITILNEQHVGRGFARLIRRKKNS